MITKLAIWWLKRHGYHVYPKVLADVIWNIEPSDTPFLRRLEEDT